MWRHSFDTNVQTLVPILSDHISQKNLGVAGIKWLPAPRSVGGRREVPDVG
jgi:hypothetical protein